MTRSACRSCNVEPRAWWATFAGSGKRVLMNADPSDDGNVIRLDRHHGDGPLVVALKRADLDAGSYVDEATGEVIDLTDRPRYTVHFATCPNAGRHRRPKAKS